MSELILTNNGLKNAAAIIQAAEEFGLELAVAAAFAQHESGGKMVYGHDLGGTYSTNKYGYNVPDDIGGVAKYSIGSNIEVTKENYWGSGSVKGFFKRVITDGGKSNGVGIYQITYKGFLTDADNTGFDLSDPLGNARYGAKLIKSYIKGGSDEQIQRAACRYNTGREDGWETHQYSTSMMREVRRWRELLKNAAVLPPVVVPEPLPMPEPTPVPEPTPEPVPVENNPEIEPDTPQPAPEIVYMWTTRSLNLRASASTYGKYILTMPPKARVQLTGRGTDNNWFEVWYNGKLGWCHGMYLSNKKPKKKWWKSA